MTWNTEIDDSDIIDRYRYLSGVSSEQAWSACSWINSMIEHGYNLVEIKIVIDTYPSVAKTYAISPERYSHMRTSRYYSMVQPVVTSISSFAGSLGAYFVAKPAAVAAAVGGATAATATATTSAALIGPSIVVGASLLITGLLIYPDKLTNMREKKLIATSEHEVNCMKIFLDAILNNIIMPSYRPGTKNFIVLNAKFNPVIPLRSLSAGKGIYKELITSHGYRIAFLIPMTEVPWIKDLDRAWSVVR